MQAKPIVIWESESKEEDEMAYNFKETMNKPERLSPEFF